MTDHKIRIKKEAAGSLIRRILFVCILVLIVPLFFHAYFLYAQEYQQTLSEWQEDLVVVAKERAHLLSIVGTEEVGDEIPFTHPVRIALLDENGHLLWENRTFPPGADILAVREPIEDTDQFIELSMDKASVERLHREFYYYRFASLLFFVGGLGGLIVYLLTRRMGRPLKELCRTMDRVASGSIHTRYTQDRFGFEVNELGLRFNDTLDALQQSEKEATSQRQQREKLADELRIGHEIQSNLLPKQIPGLKGLDIATGYLAALEVNGDFYDLHQLDDGRLMLAVCDTAGKGISACLFSLGLRSILRTVASLIQDPAELVRRANELYYKDAHESSMFSTLWLGIYDPKTRNLVYCSQGHPPALLLRGGKVSELQTMGIALGAQKLDHIQTKEIILEKEDLLLLYTDGVVEAQNRDGTFYGKELFYSWLYTQKKADAHQVVDGLIKEVRHFAGTAPQHDDITLLVLKVSD